MNARPTTPSSSGGLREFVKGAVALVIGLVVALLLLELATRYVLDDGRNFDIEMWKYASDIKRVSDIPELGHEHTPNTEGFYMGVPVTINSMGLRNDEISLAKPDGVVRILMLGDSVTFGWGVLQNDTVAAKLQELLNATPGATSIEVINSGVGNYNTVQEITYFLSRGIELDPDIVVLNYFINDAEPTPQRHNSSILEHSYLAVFAMGRIDALMRTYFGKEDWKDYYAGLYRPDAPGWQAALKSMDDLIAYTQANGIRLLIANYPELHQLDPYPFEKVTAAVEEVATSHGVAFVDLLPSVVPLVPETLWVSPEDAHPNAVATDRFADALAETLRTQFPDLVAP